MTAPGAFRQYPTAAYLRQGARRRSPRFAFEFMDGGAGADLGIARNARAFAGIELLARYGGPAAPPDLSVTLFGQDYAAPVGIAPMGATGIVRPGGDAMVARAAQAARVPYVLSLMASLELEKAAALAPDVLWFQLYRCGRDDHRLGRDLVARARAAGVRVLVLTMDTPVRGPRPREIRAGIVPPFRFGPRLGWEAAVAPRWLAALARHGVPRFANFLAYVGPGAGLRATETFAGRELDGGLTWEDVRLYRDLWPGPLVLKGLLHPEDVDLAIAAGVDGVVVSNHGGRQLEALPPPVEMLPEVVARAGGRLTVLLDSGVQSGLDVARALALGAAGTLSGKAVLWGLGALGAQGPGHAIALLTQGLSEAMAQCGCARPEDLRRVAIRRG